MNITGTVVNVGGEEFTGTDFNFPFNYGSWSPRQTIYNNNGTVVMASFKLSMSNTHRSEVKSSGLKIMVEYTVEHNGERRVKQTEQIKYLDAERKFKTSENFTFKTSKYEVKVIKLSYNAELK